MVVPGCPVIGHAAAVFSQQSARKERPPVPTREKIILTGNGLTKATVNQQAEFVIDATDAAPGIMSLFAALLYCDHPDRPQHSLCPFVRLSVCLSVCLSAHLYVCFLRVPNLKTKSIETKKMVPTFCRVGVTGVTWCAS